MLFAQPCLKTAIYSIKQYETSQGLNLSKTAIDSIKQYETSQGPNLSKLNQVLITDLNDFNITPTDAQKQEFKSSIQVKYIQAIVMELQNRFPDVDNLDTFSIFDLQKLLSMSDSDKDELLPMVKRGLNISRMPMVMERILMLTVLNVPVSGKV